MRGTRAYFLCSLSHDDIVVWIDILERDGAGGCPLLGNWETASTTGMGRFADGPQAAAGEVACSDFGSF